MGNKGHSQFLMKLQQFTTFPDTGPKSGCAPCGGKLSHVLQSQIEFAKGDSLKRGFDPVQCSVSDVMQGQMQLTGLGQANALHGRRLESNELRDPFWGKIQGKIQLRHWSPE